MDDIATLRNSGALRSLRGMNSGNSMPASLDSSVNVLGSTVTAPASIKVSGPPTNRFNLRDVLGTSDSNLARTFGIPLLNSQNPNSPDSTAANRGATGGKATRTPNLSRAEYADLTGTQLGAGAANIRSSSRFLIGSADSKADGFFTTLFASFQKLADQFTDALKHTSDAYLTREEIREKHAAKVKFTYGADEEEDDDDLEILPGDSAGLNAEAEADNSLRRHFHLPHTKRRPEDEKERKRREEDAERKRQAEEDAKRKGESKPGGEDPHAPKHANDEHTSGERSAETARAGERGLASDESAARTANGARQADAAFIGGADALRGAEGAEHALGGLRSVFAAGRDIMAGSRLLMIGGSIVAGGAALAGSIAFGTAIAIGATAVGVGVLVGGVVGYIRGEKEGVTAGLDALGQTLVPQAARDEFAAGNYFTGLDKLFGISDGLALLKDAVVGAGKLVKNIALHPIDTINAAVDTVGTIVDGGKILLHVAENDGWGGVKPLLRWLGDWMTAKDTGGAKETLNVVMKDDVQNKAQNDALKLEIVQFGHRLMGQHAGIFTYMVPKEQIEMGTTFLNAVMHKKPGGIGQNPYQVLTAGFLGGPQAPAQGNGARHNADEEPAVR